MKTKRFLLFTVSIITVILMSVSCDLNGPDPDVDVGTTSVIDIAAIPGVTVPSVGETPVSSITETNQYT